MPNKHRGREWYVHVCVYMREGKSTKGITNQLCSRHIICILTFPVVTPAVVTTLMKTAPRHCGVFALARTPCALTEFPMLVFQFP
jgi:hypothetical protein